MNDAVDRATARECHSFSRYLVGAVPSEGVTRAYARGLLSTSFLDGPAATPLDDVLLSLASAGPRWAGVADAWGRFFAPAGQLRRRLVLLLAITESRSPECQVMEPGGSGRVASFVALLGAGLGFAARLLLAVPIVLPLHISAAVRSRSKRRSEDTRSDVDVKS